MSETDIYRRFVGNKKATGCRRLSGGIDIPAVKNSHRRLGKLNVLAIMANF